MSIKRFFYPLLHNKGSKYNGLCLGVAAIMSVIILTSGACKRGNTMGELRGMWQVMLIETPDADNPGGDNIERPMSKRLYISFDQDVVQLSDENDEQKTEGYLAVYAGEVTGENPAYTLRFASGDAADGMRIRRAWGIDTNPVKMQVLTLDRKQLIVKMGDNTITMRRF